MDERQTEQGMGVIAASQETAAALPQAMVGGPTEPSLPTLTGSFLGISARRAYRLNIQTNEVLVQERAALESQARHITDPDQQAFLAWRRSILLVVAVMFVPLSVSRVFEAFDGPQLSPIGRAFKLLPAITEALFCIVAFDQLKNWTQWRKQRRILFIAWGLYFLAPFVVYLFPFRSVFDNLGWRQLLDATKVGDLQLLTKQNVHMLVGLVFGVEALLALGPKVISLMPGLIRASIVTKLLFPGTTAPGWLMMLAAPFYALFAYIIVLLPYQVTGSWHFVAGNAGLLVAQVFIGISGRRLTVPLTNAEAQHRIHRTWLAYILMLVVSAVFMVYGLTDFIRALHLGTWRVVSSVLTVVSNVLLDTLVGTDAIVTAMAYFRRRDVPDPAHAEMLRDAERKLDVFCG
jgi:hypothetical protein